MAHQISPSAPSLPPTSAIKDPAARAFAATVAEVLRVLRSSSGASVSAGLTEDDVKRIVAANTSRTAVQPVTAPGSITQQYEHADPRLQMHLIDFANPHAVTAEQIGAVAGPASAVDGHVAVFDGATGKAIKDTGLTLSGTNTGDETTATLGATGHAAAEATGLIASDELQFIDTTATPVLKRITWANFRASVRAYLDSFYAKVGAATGSGLTMSAGTLLGRNTSGTGAVEEITLGTGLTMTGGTLSTSGAGTVDAASIGQLVLDAAAATTPELTDSFPFVDIVTTPIKRITWANLRAAIKSYLDSFYAPIGAVGGFTYATTPPLSPAEGHRWVQSSTGIEYTYVNDGTSAQWVEL